LPLIGGSMRIVLIGLSITSSWGNGHATNFRALMRSLTRRGHDVTFLERDVPWYAEHRDLPEPPFGTTHLYSSVGELRDTHGELVADADLVLVGSYVPDGIEVAAWVTSRAHGITAFYDIDTPVTLAALERGDCAYIDPHLVGRFDVYLSFTGGPTLQRLEQRWGARAARAFYCMVDEDAYAPAVVPRRWELGYLGTYGVDRQPALDRMLIETARRAPSASFVVAGPQYPDPAAWPHNVEHVAHLPPGEHRAFYSAQRFTVNVTRADMITAGWSPSVRLFEAAACGVPVISDPWSGLDAFFVPGEEIWVVSSTEEVVQILATCDDEQRDAMGAAARARVLREHTADHRAGELEEHVVEARSRRR
jgi:spore maturation protein CgeB